MKSQGVWGSMAAKSIQKPGPGLMKAASRVPPQSGKDKKKKTQQSKEGDKWKGWGTLWAHPPLGPLECAGCLLTGREHSGPT